MPHIEPFDDDHLREICATLADTKEGLTDSEITKLLSDCRFPGDNSPYAYFFGRPTKRQALYSAFTAAQNTLRSGAPVVQFIEAAMKPVRYVRREATFEKRCAELNRLLSFAGIRLGEDGKARSGEVATTLKEARERASRLKGQLEDRGVHADILRFCRPELVQENYFHAVLEASKSVSARIREKTGLKSDGGTLIEEAFNRGPAGYPRLAFNKLETDTDRNEQDGLVHMMKGIVKAFRNPTAHEPKIEWRVSEEDALDVLSTISLIHRRLDRAAAIAS